MIKHFIVDKINEYPSFKQLVRLILQKVDIVLTQLWIPIGKIRFIYAYRQCSKKRCVYLQVASSSNRINGWLNTDINYNAPLYLDCTRHLPMKNEGVNIIFGEHFIEHISRKEAIAFLQESFRVLAPGGSIRLSTPDIKTYVHVYLNDPEKLRLMNKWTREIGYSYTYHNADLLNRVFHDDQHKYLYDELVLAAFLMEAGFVDIKRYCVGESNNPLLKRLERHAIGSIEDEFTLILEARKPSAKRPD
jgi:predicted SAM-dependent methyltransferase